MKPPSKVDLESLSLSAAERIAVCVRFEQSWQAGQTPRLDHYLEGVPESERGTLLRELVRIERHYRRLRGEPPTFLEQAGPIPGVAPAAEPGPALPLTLTVTEGPNRGQVFAFERHDLFLVGRSTQAHFAVSDDPYFSRLHFLVEFNPPLCRILDMRSRSRTLLVRAIDRFPTVLPAATINPGRIHHDRQ